MLLNTTYKALHKLALATSAASILAILQPPYFMYTELHSHLMFALSATPMHMLLPYMAHSPSLFLPNSNSSFWFQLCCYFSYTILNQVGCPVPAPTTSSTALMVAQTRDMSQIQPQNVFWLQEDSDISVEDPLGAFSGVISPLHWQQKPSSEPSANLAAQGPAPGDKSELVGVYHGKPAYLG